jgi:Alpha amylase, catalytic domain
LIDRRTFSKYLGASAGFALMPQGLNAAAGLIPAPNGLAEAWLKTAVLYQIYPRSFQDSNGDGLGDFPGITSRLVYLQDLGIDAVWITACFDSPNADNGYDVRDYRRIHPTLAPWTTLSTSWLKPRNAISESSSTWSSIIRVTSTIGSSRAGLHETILTGTSIFLEGSG